ncbi:MAG: nitroreductase family protein [Bacillota bacterium]
MMKEMITLELFEVIYQRRSIRSYLRKKVDREILDKIVDAGRWAPTAGNAQAWQFVIVDDPIRITKLKSVSPGIFHEPAFVIAICTDRDAAIARMGPQGAMLALMDVCMAAENILLAACALGLGACVVRSFHQQAVGVMLGCPEGCVTELLIAGGFPDQEPTAPSRKNIEEIRFFNRWEDK